MKKSDFLREVRGLDTVALVQKTREVAEELMKLRFRRATGQNENAMRVRSLRLDLARAQTVLAEKAAPGKSVPGSVQ